MIHFTGGIGKASIAVRPYMRAVRRSVVSYTKVDCIAGTSKKKIRVRHLGKKCGNTFFIVSSGFLGFRSWVEWLRPSRAQGFVKKKEMDSLVHLAVLMGAIGWLSFFCYQGGRRFADNFAFRGACFGWRKLLLCTHTHTHSARYSTDWVCLTPGYFLLLLLSHKCHG